MHQGKVDLLCAPMSATLAREQASFSIPIFAGGNRAVLRTDAPRRCSTRSEKQGPGNRLARRPAAKVLKSDEDRGRRARHR